MSKQDSQKTIKTSIGGQAVIEGVMMRGPKVTALSVRLPDNTISTEEFGIGDAELHAVFADHTEDSIGLVVRAGGQTAYFTAA